MRFFWFSSIVHGSQKASEEGLTQQSLPQFRNQLVPTLIQSPALSRNYSGCWYSVTCHTRKRLIPQWPSPSFRRIRIPPNSKKTEAVMETSLLCPTFCTVLLLHIRFFEMIKPLPGESFKNVFDQDLKCLHCFWEVIIDLVSK